MFLLATAFSFANFETTKGSRGKANISFLYLYLMIKVNYTAKKKLLLKDGSQDPMESAHIKWAQFGSYMNYAYIRH